MTNGKKMRLGRKASLGLTFASLGVVLISYQNCGNSSAPKNADGSPSANPNIYATASALQNQVADMSGGESRQIYALSIIELSESSADAAYMASVVRSIYAQAADESEKVFVLQFALRVMPEIENNLKDLIDQI